MIPRQSANMIPDQAIALCRWSTQIDPLADSMQRQWLRRAGALTAGLRKLGRLELGVIRQTTALPTLDERLIMRLTSRQPVHIREICLSIDGQSCVVARSVVSLPSRRGHWQAIGQLGRRPLADILYDDRHVRRSAFETGRIHSPHPLARLALSNEPTSSGNRNLTYWARRSVFWRGGDPLLVAECFLPAFWAIATTESSTNG